MVTISGLSGSHLGVAHPICHKFPLRSKIKQTRSDDCRAVVLACGKISRTNARCLGTGHFRINHVVSAGRNNHALSYDDDLHPEPFWSSLIKEVVWSSKSLFTFLCEQPSQLKYIEWPSFQSTLRTATLTLILVALLIVALSSVDSALHCMLSWFLRGSS